MPMLRNYFFALALLLPLHAAATESGAWTLSVDLHGRRLEGYPLKSNESQVSLLLRDGQLVEFAPNEVSDFKKASSSFRPFSSSELRAELQREIGNKLQVTETGHYVVAHPPGAGAAWADRFEEFYRSMMHYFTVRGFQIKQPEFPLPAIVWNNREDFLRYAAAEGARIPPGVIGYYSPKTNRVTLYDMTAGSGKREAWRQNAATVVHEAAHQMAFNTGVHTRFAETPTWVAEGLGTLFETRGVWDARNFPNLEDRVNRDRLADFRQYLASGRPAKGHMLLIADDRLFRANPLAAYAEAWALSFYLSEKEPRKYAEYLERTARLKPFETYPSARRVADFQSIFGSNSGLFDANFLRFIAELK
jgi:hypothetical protein